MKLLAIALLLGVFLRHDSANWIAPIIGMTPAAVFYMLGGLWEAILCCLILWALYGYPWTIWRGLASAACVIGMLEGGQIAVCRMAVSDIRAVPTGVNLCDHITGLPIGAVATSLYILLICWHVGRLIRERSPRRS